MNKTIVALVVTTLAVMLALVGLGAFALRAVAEPGAALAGSAAFRHGHGQDHGMARACAHLDDEHVSEHTAELNRWASDRLALDETQSAALSAVTATLGDWAVEMRPVCEMPLDGAPAHVAAVVRAAQTTDSALQRFSTTFDAFYATLTADQRAEVDNWFAHRHGGQS
jgi:hypothetical protein